MDTYREKIVLNLECKLTPKEHKDASKKLSDVLLKHRQVDDEIAAFKAQKKAEIEQIDGEIHSLTLQVNTEKIIRPVECDIEFDFGKGVKTTVRRDTGEIVNEGKITDAERQTHFDLGHGKKKDEPKK